MIVRNKFNVLFIYFFLLLNIQAFAQSEPNIDIWYGLDQKFGQLGNTQNYINILGNVSDPDTVVLIGYTLNNGSFIEINLGPDDRRLQNKNDFNVDIEKGFLNSGNNNVHIYSKDKLGNDTTVTVKVTYTPNVVWETEYGINWDTITNIQDVAQVVDGKWEITSEGLHIIEPGYDRLVSLGDVSWQNYEATFPITIHKLDTTPNKLSGFTINVGALVRWTGHTDVPIAGWQPKSGFEPLGNILWFQWDAKDTSKVTINSYYGEEKPYTPKFNTKYIFKVRVATLPGTGHVYYVKFWESDEVEPDLWILKTEIDEGELGNGSLLLLAHHTEATFGNVSIKSVNPSNYPTANFNYTADNADNLKISFDASTSTDPNSDIDKYVWEFGDGNIGYGQNIEHIFETGIYTTKLTTIDTEGNTSTFSKDLSLNRFNESMIVSDDFNAAKLDSSLWNFVNPKNDGSYDIVGYGTSNVTLNLNVAAGESHDVWIINNAVRVMQGSNDSDFQLDVKFYSQVNKQFQEQGLIVQQDANNYIRYDYFSDGVNMNYFIAKFTDGVGDVIATETIDSQNYDSLYLRISRQGDSWNMEYALENQPWESTATFNFKIAVDSVGVFAGNSEATAPSGPAPAYTAIVDYFFNTYSPIENEDEFLGLPVASFKSEIDVNDPLIINFDASESFDFMGSIVKYDWDFGDGTTGNGKLVSHKYGQQVVFTVKLIVTDNDGKTDQMSKDVRTSSSFVSDDFNLESLNMDNWTFINPKGDGSFLMDGFDTGQATISLSVPDGVEHNVWDNGNESVRIMQNVSNEDFEIEVKFESPVTKKFQSQGIIVEQDLTNFIRFDLFSDGAMLHNFSATFIDNNPTTVVDDIVSSQVESPLYLKINRMSDTWTMYYSLDGSDWINTKTFDYNLNVSKIGLFVLNAGSTPPAFTSVIDYIFNTDSPISPEDGVEIVTSLEDEVDVSNVGIDIYPNPVENHLNFNINIKHPGQIYMHVYDARGNIVYFMENEYKTAGSHSIIWDMRTLPAGIYILKGHAIVAGKTELISVEKFLKQ